ncbi:MAG: methylated-DNA--[protein]-cysteine S-methyltransferase [Planctomycetota bacterium]
MTTVALPDATIQSPIGLLRLTANDGALVRIDHVDTPEVDSEVHDNPTDDTLRDAIEQLTQYFAGDRQTFDLRIAPAGTPFEQRVWHELHQIPFGETRSYTDLASALGDPNAVRAVGRANSRNPLSIIIPCHRVIGANGSLTGYAGGLDRKAALLRHEGVLLV